MTDVIGVDFVITLFSDWQQSVNAKFIVADGYQFFLEFWGGLDPILVGAVY